jgi:hypothetical protein
MNLKKRIALGTALLLTLGTAVAGTLMYGHDASDVAPRAVEANVAADAAPTPAMIEAWKATASADDSMSVKLPI